MFIYSLSILLVAGFWVQSENRQKVKGKREKAEGKRLKVIGNSN
jgi:hypothetical protein